MARVTDSTKKAGHAVQWSDLPRLNLACPSVSVQVRRLILTTTVFAIVISACTSGGESTTTSGEVASTTTSTMSPSSTSSTTSSPSTTLAAESDSDRPQAPDFTLELGEGGTYTLSEGAKPVYLVFWAEW